MPTLKIENIVKDPSQLKAMPLRRKITIFNFIGELLRRRKLEKHLKKVRKELSDSISNRKNHVDNSHIFFNFKG